MHVRVKGLELREEGGCSEKDSSKDGAMKGVIRGSCKSPDACRDPPKPGGSINVCNRSWQERMTDLPGGG